MQVGAYPGSVRRRPEPTTTCGKSASQDDSSDRRMCHNVTCLFRLDAPAERLLDASSGVHRVAQAEIRLVSSELLASLAHVMLIVRNAMEKGEPADRAPAREGVGARTP
jgi:hypothetical protein